jgi:hypothetical protein
VPLAAEVNRWIHGALPRTGAPAELPGKPVTSQREGTTATHRLESAAAQESVAQPLIRSKHRRVRTMQRSLSRRRARRA